MPVLQFSARACAERISRQGRVMNQLGLALDDPLSLQAQYDDGTYPPGFFRWVQDNWHIYDAVVALAKQAQNRGFRHWSVQGALEILRWQTAMREANGPLKINHNARSGLARLAMAREPELAGFFVTRTPPGRDEAVRLDGSRYAA